VASASATGKVVRQQHRNDREKRSAATPNAREDRFLLYFVLNEELVAEFDGESGGGLGGIQSTDRFISFYHFSTGYVRGLLGKTDIPVGYGGLLRLK
jgi:hypothetical protein